MRSALISSSGSVLRARLRLLVHRISICASLGHAARCTRYGANFRAGLSSRTSADRSTYHRAAHSAADSPAALSFSISSDHENEQASETKNSKRFHVYPRDLLNLLSNTSPCQKRIQ